MTQVNDTQAKVAEAKDTEAKKVPSMLSVLGYGVAAVVLLVLGLMYGVETAKRVFVWEKGEGLVADIEEGVTRGRRTGERPSYRPVFVVKQPDGTLKSYRSTEFYTNKKGIEVGDKCAIRYSSNGEGVLDTWWGIYGSTTLFLGLGLVTCLAAWSTYDDRKIALKENQEKGIA